ncbi:MAG: peptidylprolyl isomerase [Chlorobi bacterium]|nr:peptidylprolyl isomerase [Chlorobiota bacterium]
MILKKIILLSLTVLLTGLTGYAQDKMIDEIVGVVGQKIILKSDVESMALQYKSRGENNGENLKCFAFEELLYQALLVNQAGIDSIEVSDTQVNGELTRRMNKFEEQMGGREAMEKYFNKPYSDIENHFRSIIKDQLTAQQMEGTITGKISVTPQEVKKYFKTIPKDSLPLIDIKIELAQIVIHPKIKDSQIKQIKKSLQEYKDRVQKGEDFGFLAGMYSDDIASAQKDGDLGWVRRGDLVPEFAAAAFEMTKPNEVSDIVKTEYGYHIIQFLGRKGERIHIKHILKIPKPLISEKIKAKAKLDSIAANIRSGKISFEKAAILYSDDKESSKSGGIVVNPYTGTSEFSSSQLDPATNYILKQMKVGEISEPYESTSMKGKPEIKIIKLLNKTKPHIADINTDYQEISDLAKAHKKTKLISDWISKTQKTTYIKIDDSFYNCDFKYKGWLSK